MANVDVAAGVARSRGVNDEPKGSVVGRRWRRNWSGLAPALVLLMLAPAVAEVLFGATPITNPGAMLPDVAVYGCGALLIQEVARRRGLGWSSILLLGVAFGIVEEGLALESLFNPSLFNAGDLGGRALGINWVWAQWTLGYHAVWSISIPILLTELVFSARRSEPWLGRAGLITAGVFYVLGVLAFSAIFRFVVAPGFVAPTIPFTIAVLGVVGLVALALWRPVGSVGARRSKPVRGAPSPWLVGLLAFVATGAWFVPLLDLPDTLRTGTWVLVPTLPALVTATVVAVLFGRWSAPERPWTDLQRLALAMGVLPASVLYGFFYVTADSLVDRTGQAVASVVAMVLLGLLVRRVHRRILSHEVSVRLTASQNL
jgi:hypothetical protein